MKLPHEELPELSEVEAIDLLKVHAASCEDDGDDGDERMQAGFMFSLYGWNGKLNAESFREVMACIKSLGPSWSSGLISTSSMRDLWSILYLGNFYVHDPRRIEQRRKLVLKPEEFDVEEEWLDCIGWAVMTFLEFNDTVEAFRCYDEHITKQRARSD